MRSPIDLAALHHQEEAVLVLREQVDCLAGHLGQGGNFLMISFQPIRNGSLTEQRPDGCFRTVSKSLDIIQINAISIILQILLEIVVEVADTAAHHHVEVVVDHLRGNDAVTAALVGMRCAVGGRGVRELAGENQTGGFVLQNLGRLQESGQGLVGTGCVNGHQIVVGGHGIGGDKAGLCRHARDIAGGRRRRVTNGRIRRMRAHQTTDVGVYVQGGLGGVHIGLVPTGTRQQTRGGAVGNQQYHVLDGLGLRHRE